MRDGAPSDLFSRNFKVVTTLVLSMASTAALLLLLETPTHAWAPLDPLAARPLRAVRAVTIEAVAAEAAPDPSVFDCAILPDGRLLWQPRGPELRVAVIGRLCEPLGAGQARALLEVLGRLSGACGLDRGRIALATFPPPAAQEAPAPHLLHDLRDLLVRKGIIH